MLRWYNIYYFEYIVNTKGSLSIIIIMISRTMTGMFQEPLDTFWSVFHEALTFIQRRKVGPEVMTKTGIQFKSGLDACFLPRDLLIDSEPHLIADTGCRPEDQLEANLCGRRERSFRGKERTMDCSNLLPAL